MIAGRDPWGFLGADTNGSTSADPRLAPLPYAAKEMIACTVVMATLAAILVGLRIYCRAFIVRAMGKDDWAILVALLISIGYSVETSLQAVTLVGRHIWHLTQEEVTHFLQLHYSAVISYNAGLASVKISILFLYLRLFGPAFIVLRRVSYAFLGIVVIAGLWGIFSAAIFCWPVASFWDTSIKGSCLPQKPRWLSVASLNLATDFMIFFLPLPVIAKMQMPKGEKICLIFVLTVGFFVCIVSILRLRAIYIAADSTDSFEVSPAAAEWYTAAAKWSSIELNTAIICPCIATLKPLVSRMCPRFVEKLRGAESNSAGSLDVGPS